MEARRLWELEDLENAKLTTFQATILLSLAYNSHGMGECKDHVRNAHLREPQRRYWVCPPAETSPHLDKIGDIFIRHAVSMARRMGLFTDGPALKNSRTQRAREFTAWAFFNFQT